MLVPFGSILDFFSFTDFFDPDHDNRTFLFDVSSVKNVEPIASGFWQASNVILIMQELLGLPNGVLHFLLSRVICRSAVTWLQHDSFH